ncbi:MAG TPA: hypothetical protein VHH11_16305 [Gammaproteobacteria bacterium]|jgi:hypothetical protein|nr:hypothetical protein [Gammaproteobacteria bacterium]
MTSVKTLVLFAVLLLAGTAHAADGTCAPSGGLQFVCGPKNAEDLVAVPNTKWLLSSGMADGGGVMAIDTRDGSWHVAYPGASPRAVHDAKYPDCTTPPDPTKLQTHGLNLLPGRSGHSTLYAVAHGARESIEVFDVDASAQGKAPQLTWQGCVPMPEGLAANSVASFGDGSLVATVLLMPGKTFADSIAKRPTGAVFEWSPGKRGFELVKGSELPGNNGIETSPDGREIYVVSSGFQTVVAFSHTNPTKQLRSTKPLPFTPDNVHRGLDGRLRTAGMANDVPECGGPPGPQHDLAKLGSCPRGTIAMEIDPKTMQDKLVVQTPANKDFSNATMVLVQDGQFWLGTFSGDRVAHGPLR